MRIIDNQEGGVEQDKIAERKSHDASMQRVAGILLKEERLLEIAEAEIKAAQVEERAIIRLVLELMAYERLPGSSARGFGRRTIFAGGIFKGGIQRVSCLSLEEGLGEKFGMFEIARDSKRVSWSMDGEIYLRGLLDSGQGSQFLGDSGAREASFGAWRELNGEAVGRKGFDGSNIVRALEFMTAWCSEKIDTKAVAAETRIYRAGQAVNRF